MPLAQLFASSHTILYTAKAFNKIIIMLLLHQFNGLFSRTAVQASTRKVKTSLDLNEARDDWVLGCSGISRTICKQYALRFRCRNKGTKLYWHTHAHPFNGPFPELPGWAGTRKVKAIWILPEQETMSGIGISWAICKSASRSRQITMPVPHHSSFFTGRMPFLPPNQQRPSTEGFKS